MTDTRKTTRLLAALDASEVAHTAVFAKARQLLAGPHPITVVEVHHTYPNVPTVHICASQWPQGHADVEDAMASWAGLLDCKVTKDCLDQASPGTIHYFAEGSLDNIRVSVWGAAPVPITDPVVTPVRKRWRITYQQGGVQRSTLLDTGDDVELWIKNWVSAPAVPA